MPRSVVRALTGVLALTAAAAVTPLASPSAAVADSIIVGGQPAPVADSPWVVALSSRDRFGGARSGQFCGGVAVAPTKILTAAHCLSDEALGGPAERVRDLLVIMRPGTAERIRRPGDPGPVHLGEPGVRPGLQRRMTSRY